MNDTGNGILLSTSYYLYHYLLPYKACHAPHMLARTVSFSKSIDLLLLGYNASSYSTGGEIITTLWFIICLTNIAWFKSLVLMFGYTFVPLKKLSGSETGLDRSYGLHFWIVLIGLVNININLYWIRECLTCKVFVSLIKIHLLLGREQWITVLTIM